MIADIIPAASPATKLTNLPKAEGLGHFLNFNPIVFKTSMSTISRFARRWARQFP